MEDDPAVGHALDLRPLDHRGEVPLRVDRADAARDGAVLRKGPVQVVGHHAVAVPAAVELREIVADHPVGLGSVEIVGIDDGERLVNRPGRHHHGVVRTPGLHAAFGHGEPFGQVFKLLIDHLHGDPAAETIGREDLQELLGKGVADDEDHLAETGADGVIDRIVDDRLVVGADTVHLLE